jgi:DUF4097 and DUF4098 domain-containing protein YvlB
MKTKVFSLIALGLLLVGLIGAAMSFSNSNLKKFIKNGQYENQFSNTEQGLVQENNFSNLNINVDSIKVELKKTNASTISWSLGGYTRNLPKVETLVKNDTLSISIEEKNQWFSLGHFISNELTTLTIFIPENSELNSLDIDCNSGMIKCRDLNFDYVDINLDSGIVDLISMKGKEIKIESDSGIIKLDQVSAHFIEANVDSGKLNLEHVRGDIKSKVDSGILTMTSTDLDQNIDLQVDSGIVKINAEAEPQNATINLNIDSGIARVFGQSYLSNARVGNGQNQVNITVDSGTVTIEK